MEKPFDDSRLELPGPGCTRRQNKPRWPLLAAFLIAALFVLTNLSLLGPHVSQPTVRVPLRAADTLAKCRALSIKPGPPPGFSNRTVSDRYAPGTPSMCIRNAVVWTGAGVVRGDVWLEGGLIKAVGNVGGVASYTGDTRVVEIDAKGAWVTPGIVDVHSHSGDQPSPALQGASDSNSNKGLALPWLRSLDGLNTHDESYALAIAGGVTTSLVLPGSADAIGGQAFTIKMRETMERSSSSMLVDPPYGLNGTPVDYGVPPRWRHMKHACGENPSSSFSGTRMDTVWSYREAYEHARQIKHRQDIYCAKALTEQWDGLDEFPEDLQWEALVDVLRGKVKVHTHCYEAVDIDDFVRLSNEFQFPVAAFHHAHEAYLVPAVLNRSYEHPPAVAMFASFARYKREAYRHSEFAPRVLHDEGFKVIMKSDHPAIQSRWLLHEAQQAHYYGLPADAALASVTTNAAELLGLDYRLGYITAGYDADLVIWDSHPLTLGATPIQVFIDGIPQLNTTFTKKKVDKQTAPIAPNFDKEAEAAVKFTGLPPLAPKPVTSVSILFSNVSSMWRRDETGVHLVFRTRDVDDQGVVLVEQGQVVCTGTMGECAIAAGGIELKVIDLEGGSIAPALVSAGSAVGLQEIAMETSSSDGTVFDPLQGPVPAVLGEESITRAVDGLMFGTRDALLAYRAGVATAVTSPLSNGLLGGLGTCFALAAKHKLKDGAVLDDVTSVHVAVLHRGNGPSVSTQIAVLRHLLLGPYTGKRGASFEAVAKGELPLVVTVKNADVMASLLKLKQAVEAVSGMPIQMTFVGAGEAHLLAAEIAAANVGVIVTPPRPFPYYWEGRRITEGPPVREQSLVTTLFAHGVTVGIGPQGIDETAQLSGWAVRNLRWDVAWAQIDSKGVISEEHAMDMATTNIERLLGVTRSAVKSDMVATKGGTLLSFEGKVVAVVSPRRKVVDLFE